MARPTALRPRLAALLASTAPVGVGAVPATAEPLPTGGQVVSGGVGIGRPSDGALAIRQSSQSAIHRRRRHRHPVGRTGLRARGDGRRPVHRQPGRGWPYDLPPYSPESQPAETLWPLVDEPVVDRHVADLAELDRLLDQRCAALGEQTEAIRSRTSFHW